MPLNGSSGPHDWPLVSILIVHYGGKSLLRDCLDSLRMLDYPGDRREILVIDNGSRDGSVEYVRKHYPVAEVLRNDINNYARANNLGIRRARGEYVALLNNDTKVDKRWLTELVRGIRSDERAGAAGSKVLFLNGWIQSAGHEELPNYHWGDRGLKEADRGQYSRTEEVISVSNVSALYKKDALEKAGSFDEDFNMYSEDLDMSYRLRDLGYKILFAPGSVVRHKLHGSQRTDTLRQVLILQNRLRFLAKHFPEKLPEHLFGFGEILLLPDTLFDGILDFIKKDLPKYLKDRPDLISRLHSGAEALRNFRSRCSRTVPWIRMFRWMRDLWAGEFLVRSRDRRC